jgi:hypothetical protein
MDKESRIKESHIFGDSLAFELNLTVDSCSGHRSYRKSRQKLSRDQHRPLIGEARKVLSTTTPKMPIIAPKTVAPGAPQQHKQPSRKGKKAWRKNVDVTEIQEGLEELRDEVIKGYVANANLFDQS